MFRGVAWRSAKQRGVAACVGGLVRREESIAECLAAGVVDDATLDVAEAVANSAAGRNASPSNCQKAPLLK